MDYNKQEKLKDCQVEDRLPPAKVKIAIVSNERHATKAVKKLLGENPGEELIYGIDLEWERNTHRLWRIMQPDILQIGRTDGYCAVFRLNLLNKVPTEVKHLLEDPDYIKVGVGIIDNAITLDHYFGVKTTSTLDLQHLALYMGMDPKGLGYVRDTNIGLSYEQFFPSTTDWVRKVLTQKNPQYAAMDPINAVRIFCKINHETIYTSWPSQWEHWSKEEYHEATLKLWGQYLGKPFNAG